jgi:predicted deacetylase
MKFAIRDDDTSFWTKPEELEAVYNEIWKKGLIVSLSLIPFAVRSYNCGDQDKFYQDEKQKLIGENRELIEFLQEKIRENKISIMLHGFSHQYKVAKNKRDKPVLATKESLNVLRKYKKGPELCWYGEYNWKGYKQLKKETQKGKEYLEELLHTEIIVFVPPSNDISKEGVKAVSECGLNISGIMRLNKFNRPVNLYSIKNWFVKLWWRVISNRVFPYVMKYGIHKELHAYGLVPGVSFEELRNGFEACRKLNAPFHIATHHWEVRENNELRQTLYDIVQLSCISSGVEYGTVDNLFRE